MANNRSYRIKPFEHLWKTEEPLWVDSREKDWKIIEEIWYSDVDDEHHMIAKDYFLTGNNDQKLYGIEKLFLTPVTTPDEIYNFFFSENLDATARERCIVDYFRAIRCFGALNWYRKHCQIVASGIYGSNHKELVDRLRKHSQRKVESNSWFFCSRCIFSIQKKIQGRLNSKDGYLLLIDFLMSAILYVESEHQKIEREIRDLYEDVDYAILNNDSTWWDVKTAEVMQEKKEILLTRWNYVKGKATETDHSLKKKTSDTGALFIRTDNINLKDHLDANASMIQVLDCLDKSLGTDVVDMGGKLGVSEHHAWFIFERNGQWSPAFKRLYLHEANYSFCGINISNGCINLYYMLNEKPYYTRHYIDRIDDMPKAYFENFVREYKTWRSSLPDELLATIHFKKLKARIEYFIRDELEMMDILKSEGDR